MSGKAMASLILGALTLVLWILTAIPAVILGLLALRDISKSKDQLKGTGQAIAGIFLANLWFFAILVAIVFLPASSHVENAVKHANAIGRLKAIGVAIHQFQAAHGHYPSQAPADGQTTNPSWRVQLLPYFDQPDIASLAKNWDIEQTWDNAANHALAELAVSVYQSPYQGGQPRPITNYLAVSGAGFLLNPTGPVRREEVTDGLDQTIICVEYLPSSISWAEPIDLTLDEYAAYIADPGNLRDKDGFLVLMADGSVRSLPLGTSKEQLHALFTYAGGESADSTSLR
jgi:hypothetical protein